jgi:hypothetical protein
VSERLPEPATPRTTYPPVEPGPELARKNVALGLALFGVVLLLAAGAVLVSFLYLHYD